MEGDAMLTTPDITRPSDATVKLWNIVATSLLIYSYIKRLSFKSTLLD